MAESGELRVESRNRHLWLSALSSPPFALVGPEGIEPAPCGLRVRHAACYTTTLEMVGRMRFNRRFCNIADSFVHSPSACPLDGASWARTYSAKWAGRRSNPRLRIFSPPLHPLSYQPANLAPARLTSPPTCTWFFRTNSGHAKQKPDVACDTGFRLIPQRIGQASQAERMRGLRIRRFIGESPVAFVSAYET